MEAMARVKQIAFGETGNKNDPLFMGKSIVLSNGQVQLLGILPNVLVLSVIEEEE